MADSSKNLPLEFKSSAKGKGLAFDLILAPPMSPKVLSYSNVENGNSSHLNNNRSFSSGEELLTLKKYYALGSSPISNGGHNGIGYHANDEPYNGCTLLTPKVNLTLADIENKLKHAENFRKSHEGQLKEQWREKEAKIRELANAQKEANAKARDKYDAKMSLKDKKRSQQICAMQEKLKAHEKHVMDVCIASEYFGKLVKEKLNKKHKCAKENRTSILTSLSEKLKEHEQKVEEVRKQNEEMRQEMDAKMKAKMCAAIASRQDQLVNIRLKIKEHVDHVEEVRAMIKQQSILESNQTSESPDNIERI